MRQILATVDEAQTLALTLLRFLASDVSRLERFMALTGLTPADLRSRAGEADLLTAVMAYAMADQSLYLQFCAEENIEPAYGQACANVLGAGAENGH